MASKQAVLAATAALYAAAGRNYGEMELNLYRVALADVTDGDLADATALIIRGIDLGTRAPSPALIRQTVEQMQHHAALEARPPACEPCDNTGWIEQAYGSVVPCSTCRRYAQVDPTKGVIVRGKPKAIDGPEPIRLGDSAAAALRAARNQARSEEKAV